MRRVLTCRGSRQQGAVLTPEARAERLAKPMPPSLVALPPVPIINADTRRPAPPLPVRPARSCWPDAHPLRWRREFEPTALRHLDNGPLAGQDQEIRLQGEAIRRGTALLLPHRPLKQRTIRQSRQQSLSAVGHGHFDQHQRLVNPAQSWLPLRKRPARYSYL